MSTRRATGGWVERVKRSAAFAQGWAAAGSAEVAEVAVGSAAKPMAAMAVVGLVVEDWVEVAKA